SSGGASPTRSGSTSSSGSPVPLGLASKRRRLSSGLPMLVSFRPCTRTYGHGGKDTQRVNF
ncbi:MAG: hypothetical protein ACK55I_23740, partial [bacterium]